MSIGIGLALIWISPKGRGDRLRDVSWSGMGYRELSNLFVCQQARQAITAISRKVTLALAFVMAMNYLAILLCPFIIDFFQSTVFHIKSQQFAFVLYQSMHQHRNACHFLEPSEILSCLMII